LAITAIRSEQTAAQNEFQSAGAQPGSLLKPQAPVKDTVNISKTAQDLQKTAVASSQVVQAAASGDLRAQAQLANPTAATGVENKVVTTVRSAGASIEK
jgi:predicted lipid-binding transport protein (Tim44 family)